MTLLTQTPSAADDATTLSLADYPAERSEFEWFVVNDNVMGGRSEGNFKIDAGELLFAGRTNTRGGGFSSIRTEPVQLDLSDYDGVRLKVLGDGRRYTWRLTTNARWRGRQINYWSNFDTADGTWTTVDLPFTTFIPQFRGMRLDVGGVDPDQITGMGLMIYDNKDGPFEIRLSSVQAYAAPAPFSLAQYRWQKRVLVVSAKDAQQEHVRSLLSEINVMGPEFADRDMALVILLDSGVSLAEDRELTAEAVKQTRAALGIEPGAKALCLIGKDGGVKLSEENASLDDVFKLIDTMPMRRNEMGDR